MDKKKVIVAVVLLILSISLGYWATKMWTMLNKPVRPIEQTEGKIEVEGQESTGEEIEVEGEEDQVFGTTGEDIKEMKNTNPVERDVIRDTGGSKKVNKVEMPAVYDLIKGEWVVVVSGFKQEDRYLQLDGTTYKETLGTKHLQGDRIDMTTEVPGETEGTYTFDVANGSWSGDIILDTGQVVRFVYGEVEGGEPYLRIMPNLTLIRSNFQEDYMNQEGFVYPTPRNQ